MLPFMVALSTKIPGNGYVGCDSVMCSQEQREQSRERMEGALTDPEVAEWPPLPTQETCETPPPPIPHTSTQKALRPSFFSSPFPFMCTHTHTPQKELQVALGKKQLPLARPTSSHRVNSGPFVGALHHLPGMD